MIRFTPDSDTAQQLAEAELSKAMYDPAPSLFERLIRWFFDRLESVFSQLNPGEGGAGNIAVILVIVLFIIAVIALAMWRAHQTGAASSARVRTVLFDDKRSSKELFAAATTAESSNDLNMAVIERFRAIIRLLDERELIRVVPGMTALEAALAGSERLGEDNLFNACARAFNDIYYSHGQATKDDVRATHNLHAAITEAKATL